MSNELPAGFTVNPQQNNSELPEGFVVSGGVAPDIPTAENIASDTAPAKKEKGFFDSITGESRMTPQMDQLSEIGSAPELNEMSVPAFKASLGLLTTGDTQSLQGVLTQQFGDKVSFSQDEKGNSIVNLPSGSYALNKPGLSSQDVVRTLFDFASFTPAGRAASIPAATLKSGLTQAAIDTTEQSLGGEDVDITDTAEAAAFGGIGKTLEDVISTTYRAFKGGATPDIESVSKFAKEKDLPLMTTDIAPPKTFSGKAAQGLTEKIPFAGTGLKRAQQQDARVGIMDEVRSKFGDYSPETVIESLKNQTNKIKRAAGDRLEKIGNEVGTSKAVNKTVDKIDEVVESLKRSPSGELKATADTETINKLMQYKEDLVSDPSFNSLKELRTTFRENVKGERVSMPGQTQSKIDSIYEEMSNDMFDTVKSEIGPKEAMRWRSANAAYAQQANEIKKTGLKNALEKGDVTPEVINSMLFGNKPSQSKLLYKSLDSTGKQAAKNGLISKALDKSNGSPDKFASELTRLSKNINATFKGNEKRYINGVKNYLDFTRRASKAGLETATGQQMFQLVPIAGAVDVMTSGGVGVGAAGTYGLMGRAYESKPVRDLMIKLSSVPKGSTEFEQTARALSELLTPLAQSARED
ncbi:MAG: hypothetical protein K0U08_06900 [Proteobacteria bacterium]|nr:hypothetical protein [Pseudomonadota bacterium]